MSGDQLLLEKIVISEASPLSTKIRVINALSDENKSLKEEIDRLKNAKVIKRGRSDKEKIELLRK